MDQDVTWYGARPRPMRLCVRLGPRSPSPKGGAEPRPIFGHVYCGQTAGWMKLVLGMVVGLSPGDFVLDGDPAPSPKGGGAPSPIFGSLLLWPNGWMHQDATWYGYRPQPRGFCVRWRPSRPSLKMGRSPLPKIFGPCLLWSNGWMDQDITWYGGRPSPRPHSVRREPSSPPKGGTVAPLTFWSMSVVAKQLDGSRCHLVRR